MSTSVTERPGPHRQLTTLELGDIIFTADGRSHTVRAVERRLAQRVGDMAGFVLAGEVGPQSVLFAIGRHDAAPVDAYSPIDYVPAGARGARSMCEGVVSYWAPHLPNISGALGELTYRVCAVRGSIEPLVILWRNAERVVFVKTGTFASADLGFVSLPRDESTTEGSAVRHAATVGGAAGVQAPYERSRTRVSPLERIRRLVSSDR